MGNLDYDIPFQIENKESQLTKISKENFVKQIVGSHGLKFVKKHLNLNIATCQLIYKNKDFENSRIENDKTGIISLKQFNNVRHIDTYFENINKTLVLGGTFVGFVQTNARRKEIRRKSSRFGSGKLNSILSFVFHRIPPKVKFLKPLYFFVTHGKNRRLSKAEICGRFVRSGFTITEIREDIEGLFYFVGEKTGIPIRDDKPSYGLLYKMPRKGLNGKTIGVYKFRTMHPYSEYLQDYILKNNGYSSSGKPSNDFRITSWGRAFRRVWIDELPQLINVFKGEMKIIGVRPVSERYFQDIPKHLQELRNSRKPGCIPPYVAFDAKPSKEGVLESEEIYLSIHEKDSILTDAKLILKAIYNIVVKRKRSA